MVKKFYILRYGKLRKNVKNKHISLKNILMRVFI